MTRRIDKKTHNRLGATYPAGVSQIVLFIPASDRWGDPILQAFWRDEALRTLGILFRGATAFPPGIGVWRDDDANGSLLFEQTIMVVCYADPDAFTEEAYAVLRRFLHRLGREAKQGEVGVVIDGSYYGISQYDSPGDE